MIVSIESKGLIDLTEFTQEEISFFESEKAITKDWMDNDRIKYIGPIQNTPISLLNKHKIIDIEFYKNNPDWTPSALQSFAENFSKDDFAKARNSEQSIHIHIPAPELSYFNKVDWLEDACTDALQKMLDDNWRILAVIPRVGQRRPDYILGKRV